MMNTLACSLAMLASASAFVPPAQLPRVASSNSGMSMQAAKSKSLPFMPQPASLDGSMAGDVGFDPMGLSNLVPLDFMREAELKHGRICQLAVVGFAATDLGLHLPGAEHAVSSIAAHDAAVATGAMPQILLWVSAFEAISAVAVIQMLEGSGRMPGDFGFDPLNLYSKPENAKKKADMELKEITHCRLAMCAFGGMVTQAVLTNGGFPYTG
ncbi:unnamed protein product [Ectocarpus sp. 13 AM-2016]